MSVDELTRLAFIYAEQDRRGFAEAWRGADEKIVKETMALVKSLRDYRVRRWGRTKFEAAFDGAKSANLDTLKALGRLK
jgi:hypothetical protein